MRLETEQVSYPRFHFQTHSAVCVVWFEYVIHYRLCSVSDLGANFVYAQEGSSKCTHLFTKFFLCVLDVQSDQIREPRRLHNKHEFRPVSVLKSASP